MINGNHFAGGAKTTINGNKFENEVNVISLFDKDYSITKVFKGKKVLTEVENTRVIERDNKIYTHFKYRGALNNFFSERWVVTSPTTNNRGTLSKGLSPDESIYDHSRKILFIFEKKFQNCDGSVDEKLQTCDFKKKQYAKLAGLIGAKVEYVFILSPYFENNKDVYKDVFEYIQSVGCHYYFQSNFHKIYDDFFSN